jgi:hypothetical protein
MFWLPYFTAAPDHVGMRSSPAGYHGAVRVECIIQIDAFYPTVKAGILAIAERTLRIRKERVKGRLVFVFFNHFFLGRHHAV